MLTNQTLSGVLSQSVNGLAAFAAEELTSRRAAAGTPDNAGFRYWQVFYEARINDLAAALDAGQPRLFTSQMRWCRVAMTARGVESEIVRDALVALRDVLETQMDEQSFRMAEAFLHDAINDCDNELELPQTLLDVTHSLGRLAAQFVLAVLEGRRREACALVTKAVDGGLPVKDAYLHVVVPAVREIGRMWHVGEVTVAEEHFASDTAQALIAQLQERADIAPPIGRTLLAASVAGNRHDMGTRILANLFEMEGWRVVCLGGDMPGADVAQAVIDFEADLLLLSATLHTHLRAVERTVQIVRQRRDERAVRVLVGGLAFDQSPHLAKQYGADAYAGSAEEALHTGRGWFAT